MKKTDTLCHWGIISLLFILFVLAGFSIWAIDLTNQHARMVNNAIRMDDVYSDLQNAMNAEIIAYHHYYLQHDATTWLRYRTSAAQVAHDLEQIQQVGETQDRTFVQTLLPLHNQLERVIQQQQGLFQAKKLVAARNLYETRIDHFYQHVQTLLDQEVDKRHTSEEDCLTSWKNSANSVLLITPIVFACGVLLLGIVWFVINTYRHRMQEAARERLEHLARAAFTDNLTGLGNYRAYQNAIRECVQHNSMQEQKLTMALLNVDELKIVNDEHGHLYGDVILSEIAAILRTQITEGKAYRLNGDLFAVILPGLALEEAMSLMDQVRQIIQQALCGPTVSIGIAVAVYSDEAVELLYEQADSALHEAKRRGRNNVIAFEHIREYASIVSPSKVAAVRHLLVEKKVAVSFQPIWNIQSNTVLSFEALIRPDAAYGFSGPQEAFEIAEKMGRAHELDYLCVQAILERAARELPREALLFINLTPQTLDHGLMTGAVLMEAVYNAGLAPEQVVLEITERSVGRLPVLVREARYLQELGFRLALDDTGTGNAGLEMLSQLPVDFVKIDRSLIANALSDRTVRGILAGIHAMAIEAGFYVIVEGIENVEMLTLAQELGAMGVQGYLLGRPSQQIPDAQVLQQLSPAVHFSLQRVRQSHL